MTWIWLGIASAALLGFYDVFRKAALRDNAVLPVLGLSTLAAAAPFAVLLALGRVPAADAHVHALLGIKALIVVTSWVLEFYALKQLDLSVAVPIRTAQPFFTLAGAVALFGEWMTPGRWAGIALALASYAYFARAGRDRRAPVRWNPWIACAAGAALVGAGSSLFDKFLLNRCAIDPLVVQSWYTLYIALLLGLLLLVMAVRGRGRTASFAWRWSIPCVGLLLAASDALYFHALRQPEALIAMLAVIRRANVVISFAFAALLFRETNLRPRALALAGILGGVVLMTLA